MDPTDILSRIMLSLNAPLYQRCAELAVLLDRCTFKDLQTVYPVLVDHIFGPTGSFSWSLRNITNLNLPEFNSLQNFFSPVGPFFKVIYKLLQDSKLKYDFPLSYLPTKVRQSLEIRNTIPPPFYNDLINVDMQTRTVTSLLLNPFDYYFFHFAYYLTNPWHQRGCLTWNTIYYILSCDYLLHFLPTNPNCFVYPELNYYSGKNPTSTTNSTMARLPQDQKSKLLLPTAFNQTVSEFNTSSHMTDHHPRSEIWRSETVIMVFIDMWLNNDQLNGQPQTFYPAQMQQYQYSTLPTAEYVRIVRVLVKQLHSFSASARNDSSYLGELKKIVLPMLQRRMYTFLQNLIHKWPLDGSFRLVLELWLSFIQPWRYCGAGVKLNQDGSDDDFVCTKNVDKEYLPFIADNLLAYTVIFQQLLPRFARIDLVSPKNSLMLYRVTKVFSQGNLISLLKEVESCVGDFNNSPNHLFAAQQQAAWTLRPHSPTGTIAPCLNYTKYTNSGKWSSNVRQKILELEGAEFSYKPLFANVPGAEVYDLLRVIRKSLETAHNIIYAQEEERRQKEKGFGAFWRSFFMYNESTIDEFTMEERKKVPVLLEFAKESIISIFNINVLSLNESDINENSNDSCLSAFDCTTSTMHSSDISFLMSPQNIKARLQNISYQGDPELQSIRSNEIAFIVRIMYNISSKLNEMYEPNIEQLYYSRNFLGKVSRKVLHPPIKTYSFNKRAIGSPRVQKNLPPRISLRYFASTNFLTLLFFSVLFVYLTNCNKYVFIIGAFLCWFLYVCIIAVFSSSEPDENF